ncbi:MAG TPA: hypothetical protein VEX17_04535 [Bacillales bacterium]|nr:hypothetical protein [Bacillales bacterium]
MIWKVKFIICVWLYTIMGAVYKPKDLSKRYRKKIPDELAKDIVPGANDDGDEPTLNETDREKDQ